MPCSARVLRGGGGWLRDRYIFSVESWIKGLDVLSGFCRSRSDLSGEFSGIRRIGCTRERDDGAPGDQGRQEGGQYRAGRRAPPGIIFFGHTD